MICLSFQPCNLRSPHVVTNYFSQFSLTPQNTEGRRNAYRAIVQARPPHLNNIYLATQVSVFSLLSSFIQLLNYSWSKLFFNGGLIMHITRLSHFLFCAANFHILLPLQRPEQLLRRTQLMERWARWEVPINCTLTLFMQFVYPYSRITSDTERSSSG